MAEIEVATFEQIATLLSQLSNNYSNLAVNYYDIFYNPVPQDVTIQLYDAAGVLKDYVIPNRAKDFRFVLNGNGSPEGTVSAKVGTTYQDILNGRFYIKQLGEDNKGWIEIASRDDFIKGEGSPEGIEIKPRGTLYVDTLEGSLYIKTTTTGSTGWAELPKAGDFVDRDLSNVSPEGEKKFANPALSNLNSLGESHFANPSLSNLNNIGKNIINSKENLSNKINVINSSSTNIQYPTARAVYDVTHKLDDGKASISLNNLTTEGLAKFANPELANLTTEGLAKFANPELANLSKAGNEKLNTSKMYMTGEVTNDKVGYEQLAEMKRTTFDKSKFQVVGTPTITDDGIASGFSSNSGIKAIVNIENKKNVIIETPTYVIKEQSEASNVLLKTPIFDTTTGIYMFAWQNKPNIALKFDNNGVTIVNNYNLTNNLNYGDKYKAKFILTENEVKIISYINDTEDNTKVFNNNGAINVEYICFGIRNDTQPKDFLHGSADLKQFSISVDGKEVFNGNKTGIDIIKPDNFTKVGNPVISDDGVLEGTRDNYIQTNEEFILNANNFSIKLNSFSFPVEHSASNEDAVFEIKDNNALFSVFRPANSDLRLACLIKFNNKDFMRESFVFDESKDVSVEFSLKNNVWSISVTNDGNTQTRTKTSSEILNIKSKIIFGYWGHSKVDLNSFKIYVDGNLIYQPMLRILYTESKTGSKIVDAIYRDRVKDVAEEYGRALYYTIDEEKKDITLPNGELYGFINNLKDSYANLKVSLSDAFSFDYSKGIGFSNGFVAPRAGLITMSGEIGNAAWWVQVNGKNVILVGDNATGSTYNQVTLILNKGDKITGTFGNQLFFPMKGVN